MIRLGDVDGRRVVRALEQDGELVAAEPGDGVARPDRLPQALGHLHEQEITRRMAEEVVDLLEAVEVEEEDRDAVATRRSRECPRRGRGTAPGSPSVVSESWKAE